MVCVQGLYVVAKPSDAPGAARTSPERVMPVVEGRAIFGFHEQAGCRNAKDVQIVLNAATDEEAVTA